MRYHSAFRTAGAGSTTLPIASIYAAASVRGTIREIGIFNTTATAVALKLARLSTAGTQGTGQTEEPEDPDGPAANCTVFDTHTVGPTIGNTIRQAALGAAVGSGVIWTFGAQGLLLPTGVANGWGIVVVTGTGQICDVNFTWDE